MVTPIQIVLLLVAILAYLAGGAASLAQLAGRKAPSWVRLLCMSVGIGVSTILLTWHSISVVRATGTWQPLQDNLSAMLTLAILLAGFVLYTQATRAIASLEWLVMPVVVVLLLLAGHFGTTQSHPYLTTAYSLVHRLATYLGALAFVVAGASGALYLTSADRLRHRFTKHTPAPPQPGVFGSLERLERLTYAAVTYGFAFFSVGIVTGIAWVVHEHGHTRLGAHWFLSPKVILAFAAWAIFLVVLHTPIAPRLRGRRNAILSIVGLVLTIATLFAVLLMPKGVA